MTPEQLANRFLDSMSYLMYAVVAAFIIFLMFSWYYFGFFFNALTKDKRLPKGKTNYKYAVLVPARNEDKVIKGILDSFKKQTYPKEFFDVYVIVESKDDPTVKIVKKYGYKTIIRKDLINKRTKGYALDEAYKSIKESGIKYDAFMVFDADNILDPNYIELLNDVKCAGYQVGMGYRNFTNASHNWISACSATLFAYMNQFTSKGRSNMFNKMTLTGTGYFIDFDIIDFEKGWIFNGMTEDVELTKYCYYHNIKMKYYPIAQYYDEQATSMKVIHKQHIRWVWGFFEDDKKYKKLNNPDYKALSKGKQKASLYEFNFSIYPFVVIAILLGLAFFLSFIAFVASLVFSGFYDVFRSELIPLHMLTWMIFYFFMVWLCFAIASFVTFVISNKYLKFSLWLRIKVIFTYVFFFYDFLNAFLDGLIHKSKRTSWDKIIHSGEITNKDIKK